MWETISVMTTIFLVLDPIGNVPLISSMLAKYDNKIRNRIILRESIFALILMLILFFFGNTILRVIDVGKDSISMAGGVVLFLIGLSMSFPSRHSALSGDIEIDKEPFLVPLATPLIAGPGVLSVILLLRSKINGIDGFIAIIGAWVLSLIILLLGGYITKLLGSRGTEDMQRLMGLVLTAMAVDMFMTGFRNFMRGA